MTEILSESLIPVIALSLISCMLILIDNRQFLLITLAGQYIFVAWLLQMNISIQVAAAKLVAGLLACAIMVIARPGRLQQERSFGRGAVPSGFVFRAIAFCIVLMVAIGLSRQNWVSVPSQTPHSRYVVSLLMSVGLLHLGLSDHPLRVGVGLLTVISGFEIIYSSLEPSLAVAALMAAVHLGIAVVISYLMLHQTEESPVVEQ